MIKRNGKFDPDPIRTKYKNTQHMIESISKDLRDFIHNKVVKIKPHKYLKSHYFQENQIYPILKQIPILNHIPVYYSSMHNICDKVSTIILWYRKILLYKIILQKIPYELAKIIINYYL